MAHAERQIDQIRRRVVKDEKIPQREKGLSLFEKHTERISKGKYDGGALLLRAMPKRPIFAVEDVIISCYRRVCQFGTGIV